MRRSDFIGATFLVSGVLLFGLMKLAMASYLSEWGTSGTPSEISKAVRNTLMINFPYHLSIILILVGLVLLFYRDLKKVYIKLFVDE